MPWNGSGSFSRTDGTRTGSNTWQQADAAGVNIVSPDHDTHDEDLAQGIANCVAKDGQNAPTADLPMAGYKHTNVDDATSRTHYAATGQVQDSAFTWGGTAGGTADALTIAPSPAISAYAAGQAFEFVAASDNTGAATLAVNGQAAKDITKNGTTALAAGDIAAGQVVRVVYDGTRFQVTTTDLDNYLRRDGSNAMTGPLKTDVITEASSDAGVTVDGVALKNGSATLVNAFFSGVTRSTDGGSAATPSIQPGDDNDTGMYWQTSNTIGFATAGSLALTIAPNQQVYFQDGTTALPSIAFQNDNDTGWALIASGQMSASAGGVEKARFGANDSRIPGINDVTTGSSPNVWVNSTSGVLARSTSSLRYKTQVEDLDTAYADKVLQMRPVWYRSLGSADPAEWSYYGLIAEELHDLEPRFVHYAEDEAGHPCPDGVQYERIVVPLISLVQRQQSRIDDLETRLSALEATR